MTGRAAGIAVLAMLWLAAPAAAQVQPGAGTLTVTVRDNWGIIPGAVVRVTHRESQTAMRAVTDDKGVATIGGLRSGAHDLRVEFPGFAEHAQAITIEGAEKKTLEVALTLPQFSTSVTVATANRRDELLLNVAEPTTLIDKGQIDDTGGRTAKDVLIEQAGSGITVHAGGGQGHISLNGISNSGVLVLMDGRRLLGRDGTGAFNLEDLDLSGVERIEVVKGAGSALYGSDALGGVVNIISRKGSQPGVTNSLTFTGGSYRDVRVSDTFGYRFDRGGATLAAGYRTYDGFDLSESNPQTIGQPESRFRSVAVNADYRVGDRVATRLLVQRLDRDIRNYFFSGPTQLGSNVYNSERDIRRLTISPEADILFDPNTSMNVSWTYGKYDRDENRVYPLGTIPFPWQEWNKELKLTGRHEWRWLDRGHGLQAGYERRDEQMDRLELRLPGTSTSKVTRDVNTVWVQQEVNATSRLKVTGGVRYDDYSDFGGEVSPKVSGVYSLAGAHRVRATFGHGFRAPSFGELYLSQSGFVGNPDLEPEISDTVTAGYAFANTRVQASADYFYAQIENGITFDLSRQPFTYINLTESTSRGVNTSFTVSLPYGFSPSVAYTYVRRENASGNEIGGLPNHTVFFKVLWANSQLGLRANFRAQILDRTVSAAPDGSYVPAYQIWHAQVSKKLITRGSYGFNLFVQADNLFDKRDIFRRNRAGEPFAGDFQVWIPPRTFLAGVTVDMDWVTAR